MELLQKLGIDWRLLIAQIINFLILCFVLYKFLYKPVINFLERRSKKIEESLEDAKRIKEELVRLEKVKEEKIQEAQKEAQKLITEAKKISEKNKEEIILKAKDEAEKILKEAKEQMEDEKGKMMDMIKKETVDLVTCGVLKVLEGVIDKDINRKFIEKILEEKNN